MVKRRHQITCSADPNTFSCPFAHQETRRTTTTEKSQEQKMTNDLQTAKIFQNNVTVAQTRMKNYLLDRVFFGFMLRLLKCECRTHYYMRMKQFVTKNTDNVDRHICFEAEFHCSFFSSYPRTGTFELNLLKTNMPAQHDYLYAIVAKNHYAKLKGSTKFVGKYLCVTWNCKTKIC